MVVLNKVCVVNAHNGPVVSMYTIEPARNPYSTETHKILLPVYTTPFLFQLALLLYARDRRPHYPIWFHYARAES